MLIEIALPDLLFVFIAFVVRIGRRAVCCFVVIIALVVAVATLVFIRALDSFHEAPPAATGDHDFFVLRVRVVCDPPLVFTLGDLSADGVHSFGASGCRRGVQGGSIRVGWRGCSNVGAVEI